MPRFIRIAVLLAVLTPAAPVMAKPPAPAAPYRGEATNMLRIRLLSVDTRIDMLEAREVLSPAEAQDLRALSREMQRRVSGMSTRDMADLQTQVGQLERRVGYAMEDERWGRHALDVSSDRHVDDEPYRGDGRSDYRHFDRYTAPPVDRWHDPFDRGSGL